MKKIKIIIYLTICLSLILPLYSVRAFSQYYQGNELKSTITATSDDSLLKVSLPSKTFKNNLGVFINENNNATLPDDLSALSKVYTIYFMADQKTPPYYNVQLQFNQPQNLSSAYDLYYQVSGKNWRKTGGMKDLINNNISVNLIGNPMTIAIFEALDKNINNGQADFVSSDQSLLITPSLSWKTENYNVSIKIYDNLNYPEKLKRKSDIYEYQITSETDLTFDKPLKIKLYYPESDFSAKDLYYWDEDRLDWLKVECFNYTINKYLSAETNKKSMKLAIFENQNQQDGTASWYKYKNCNCAASRDFPKGTRVRVTNITEGSKNFGKSVIVRINDFGPEIWTKRLIDMDKKAYQQIAGLKSGIMNVRIEKIND